MRTREEIERDTRPKNGLTTSWTTDENVALILEVLLDIRDLLANPPMTTHDEEVVQLFTGSKPTTSQEEV